MKISIRHELTFSLGANVPRALQHVLLTPLSYAGQKVSDWRIEMPGFEDAAGMRDAYGNQAHLVCQVKPPASMMIIASGLVETIDKAGVVGKILGDPMPAMFRRVTPLTKSNPIVHGKFRNAGPDKIALLHNLMARVGEVLGAPEASQMQSQGSQSQSQGSAKPDASARDFAHAFVGAARALEIPARYVTGYLAESEDWPAGFHAWAEAWDDGLGWIGFDAMLGLCPTEYHVRLASGLDAVSTAPVRSVPVWTEMPVEVVTVAAED